MSVFVRRRQNLTTSTWKLFWSEIISYLRLKKIFQALLSITNTWCCERKIQKPIKISRLSVQRLQRPNSHISRYGNCLKFSEPLIFFFFLSGPLISWTSMEDCYLLNLFFFTIEIREVHCKLLPGLVFLMSNFMLRNKQLWFCSESFRFSSNSLHTA